MLIDGRAQATGIKRPATDPTVLLVLNAHHDVVEFTLPEVVGGHTWRVLVDTNLPDRLDQPTFPTGDQCGVTARSLLLFALEPGDKPSIAIGRATQALLTVQQTPPPGAARPSRGSRTRGGVRRVQPEKAGG